MSYRALVLSRRVGNPPGNGSAVVVHNTLVEFRRAGVQVRSIMLGPGPLTSSDTEKSDTVVVPLSRFADLKGVAAGLVSGKATTECKWTSPEVVENAIRMYEEQPYDLIHVESAFHMPNAITIADRLGVPIVLRTHNVEWMIFQRLAAVSRNPLWRWLRKREARLLRLREAEWCQAADLCIAISPSDEEELERIAPGAAFITVYPGPDRSLPESRATERLPDSPHFVHLGSLTWGPAKDGLEWLLAEVWPTVWERNPDATLSIVGEAPGRFERKLRGHEGKGVKVLGFVDDPSRILSSAHAILVPLRSGSGVRIKVITAWANGWPVVSTSVGVEGLPAHDGVDCLIADEPMDLAHAMLRAASDPELRQQMIQAGLHLADTVHNWSKVTGDIIRASEQVVARQV